MNIESHIEKIICSQCESVIDGTVEHTEPWHSYFAQCKCGNIILESEWENVK